MMAAAIVSGVMKISGYDLLICMWGFLGPIFSVDLSVTRKRLHLVPHMLICTEINSTAAAMHYITVG